MPARPTAHDFRHPALSGAVCPVARAHIARGDSGAVRAHRMSEDFISPGVPAGATEQGSGTPVV